MNRAGTAPEPRSNRTGTAPEPRRHRARTAPVPRPYRARTAPAPLPYRARTAPVPRPYRTRIASEPRRNHTPWPQLKPRGSITISNLDSIKIKTFCNRSISSNENKSVLHLNPLGQQWTQGTSKHRHKDKAPGNQISTGPLKLPIVVGPEHLPGIYRASETRASQSRASQEGGSLRGGSLRPRHNRGGRLRGGR